MPWNLKINLKKTELGSDIDGACGQLRRRHAAKSEGETDENLCND